MSSSKKRKNVKQVSGSGLAILKHIVEEPYFSTGHLVEKRSQSLSKIRLEQHTKIFASMCPDEILDHYDDYTTRMYYTTLMLGDVSGFTDLTERYTMAGKGGPSKLTETLNSYIGAMVQEILSHKGDVLKFSGDAFIVMWKLEDGDVMRDVAIEAMHTACIIQKHFGTFDTDVGVTLKVKLAIASGKTYFTSIGNPEKVSHYIITGKPVWDVKYAEGLCRGGDILVAPSSWQWANPNEFVHEVLPDGIHTLILSSTIVWEQTKDGYKTDDPDDDDLIGKSATLFSSFATDRVPEPEAVSVLMNLTGDALARYQHRQVDYSLRPKINKVAKEHLKEKLISYMLRPVIKAVEMDEPIEYLTEMRQVVILFINVITTVVGKRRLISIVNLAYNNIFQIVDSMQGCVNKTNLFDKDLLFLCIFGLRGNTHELESQIGLRCAAKVRETLAAQRHVKSVTIGVTTGMTYCGVVGHILRREYTVIGMPVNKAARLMCAYSNKVVCDRDSFLRSHLDNRHFVLQEPKKLKGITNTGPIYEFFEQTNVQGQDEMSMKYPILGRDNELGIFQNMLEQFLNTQHSAEPKAEVATPIKNILIIKSEPRMGKSRLLDEFVYCLAGKIPYNRIFLMSRDSEIPLTLINLIFSVPLGFTTSSTVKERETKILSYLGNKKYTKWLCALNEIFNMNFQISKEYQGMQETEKQSLFSKLLIKLMRKSFNSFWIVLVDDAEFCDKASFPFLATIVQQNLIFFVFAHRHKFSFESALTDNILDRTETINLTGVDKWFHTGLACQFMNVMGIPAELEKVIQEKSMGSPGWIESYLLSLVQVGGLVIKTISEKHLRNTALVIPSVEMLKRSLSKTDRLSSSQFVKDRQDEWRMYRSSYRDSTVTVAGKKSINLTKKDDNDDNQIAICIISKNFSLEEVDTEMTMDVMILKTFDSLSPLDQVLLKYAAVFGETINRNMLENLLEETSQHDIALLCTFSKFAYWNAQVVISRGYQNLFSSHEITEALIAPTWSFVATVQLYFFCPEGLQELPKYASCGLMRFKMSMFRETTYRLMTENQKVEIHRKSLKYLQNTTRRCVACGEGHFVKLLGQRYIEDDAKERKKRETFNYMIDIAENLVGNSSAGFKEQLLSNASLQDEMKCVRAFKPIDKCPTRTFSNLDFTNCQCNLILVTAYTQILDHCRGVGRKDKVLTTILEFVEICLATCNVPQARKLLNDGEVILSQMFQDSNDELNVLPLLSGKIQILQGRCCLEIGLVAKASEYLNQAIKTLGYSFPKTAAMSRIKSAMLLKQQRLMFGCLRQCTVGVLDGDAADFTDQLANCLAQMYILFKIKGQFEHAQLAAIWGLNAALKSNRDFFVLCTAYVNMMITAHRHQYRSIVLALEDNAINVCCRKKDTVELQELNAVAELYVRIFFSRWLRGDSRKATSLGFVTFRICNTIRAISLELSILPRLIHLLIIARRHDEAVSMMRGLEFNCNDDVDKSGRTWYYALCVDIQLETGLTILPYRKCEQYYQEQGQTMINLRDPESEKRYFTCMWLWCIRTEHLEAAIVWKTEMINACNVASEFSIATSFTATKRLEGLIISYVHKINSRNIKAIGHLIVEIKKQFKVINKIIKVIKIIYPRYNLLKAYYHMVHSRKKLGMKYLQRSKTLAIKMENIMIYEWASHCEKVWTGAINSIQCDMWKENVTKEKIVGWHEIDTRSNVVPYSLPLPKFSH
ncbi:adenylate cyclase type 10 [Cephus cinctus]|uniref:Adenylate cyclase type 10 n=1 Tax=Cephus cinctus TaxID=211228 RepID=A0AAJ7RU95_CEPCN|nr:adenylate cyclase type 10 [Cephus cinctus]